jgi:hypothetical protein
MKSGLLAVAAAAVAGVSATGHHQHEAFHARGYVESAYPSSAAVSSAATAAANSCTVSYYTVTGSGASK